MRLAASRTRCTAGSKRLMSTAMMAMTTKSSIRVKAFRFMAGFVEWSISSESARFGLTEAIIRGILSPWRGCRYNASMAKRSAPASDLDSPWKEALDYFLERFLAFFFPEVHRVIDWRRGYQALDKEFQQIVHEAAAGRGLADKLFKVWRMDGRETWLLIHIAIQGQVDRHFPRRMF